MNSNLPEKEPTVAFDAASSRSAEGNVNTSSTRSAAVAESPSVNFVGSPKNVSQGGARTGRSLNDPFATALSQDDEESINWREIFTMLRRRRRIIGAAFISVLALGLLITALTKPIYQASATLELIVPQQTGGGSSELPGLTDLIDNSRARSQATQIAVLQSAGVTNGAKNRVGVLNKTWRSSLDTLGGINIQPISDTDIIQVSVQSHDPQAAQAYAKALCQEYISQSKQQNRESVNNATAYINGRLKVVRADLDRARGALREFQEENDTIDLPAEAGVRAQNVLAGQDAIRAFEAQRRGDMAQLAALRSSIARLPATNTTPAGIERNTVVEDMKKSLTGLELERFRLSQEYTPQSEQVRSLDQQISSIRQRMAREAKTQVRAWTIEKDPIRLQQTQAAALLQTQIWANDSKARAMRSALEEQRSELSKVPAQQYRLGQLTTDMQTLQTTYELLNEKSLTLRLQRESSVATARLVPGNIMAQKVSPRYGANLITSFIAGLVIAIALAALVDRLDDRVHTQQDAEHSSGLPILAQIPFLHDKTQQTLLNNMNESTTLLESYRMLRTNIEFSSLGQPLRSIVVTSTQPNEGKSTTTADLAIAMALDDKKVILVDADLRRPTLHELFDLPNRIGFTSVVAKTATLEEALQETPVPGLYFLSSGPAPPNPTELLNSRSARAVWAQIIGACDLALIDTPPALVMADAQIVTSLMDAVILVISMQEAGRRDIERTSALLSRTGTPVLGAVLNKTRAENNDYYYNKNRYYGSYVKK